MVHAPTQPEDNLYLFSEWVTSALLVALISLFKMNSGKKGLYNITFLLQWGK